MVKSIGQMYDLNLHKSSFFGKIIFRCIFVHTKSIEMRRTYISLLAFIILAFIFISCGQSIEKKLIGTWKVADVSTEFNEDEVTPEMLRQVVEMQKQIYFRFMNDSTMVIISNNDTHEASWVINEEDNVITYFFEDMEAQANRLGKYSEGQIINQTNTALGTMTITYEKE